MFKSKLKVNQKIINLTTYGCLIFFQGAQGAQGLQGVPGPPGPPGASVRREL